MSREQLSSILRQAQGPAIDLSVVLSDLLAVIFRQRLQPLDPDYVTPSGCRALLSRRPEIGVLLQEAILKQECDQILSSDLLLFEDAHLQSCGPLSPSDTALARDIEEFICNQKPILSHHAQNETRMPLWTEHSSRDDRQQYAAFIADLKIPRVGHNTACFLLHDLNRPSGTFLQQWRLDQVFQAGHRCMLINGAGTGKTRLLLEGLSTRWGLYLPCFVEPVGPGACDLRDSLLDISLMLATSETTAQAPNASLSAEDAEYTRRTIAQILLSRLIIFEEYLRRVDDLNLRMRWLMFQLFPNFPDCHDMFANCCTLMSAHDATPEYIDGRIADTILKIRSLLGPDEPIYCVVDDVQNAHSRPAGNSTMLQQIISTWDRYEGLTFVLAGQPFELDQYRSPDTPEYRLWTDMGSFDGDEAHRAFVRRYLPPDLASTEVMEKLLIRVSLWLRGRYSITTYFIYCLLVAGFQNPHTLLTSYVRMHHGIQPADGPKLMNTMLRDDYDLLVGGHNRYDPATTLPRDPQAWSSAQTVLHRLIALGQDTVRLRGDCLHLVARKFATFADADGSEVVVCEPYSVFPLAYLLFRRWGPLNGYLSTSAASALRMPPHHPSFHLASITLLLLALNGDRKLCDIFAFAEPIPEWALQTCKLVRLTRSQEGTELHAVPYSTPFPQREAEDAWATESPDWLQHTSAEPFCVASGFSRADLLFVIQLAKGDVFYVALKIVLKNKDVGVSTEHIRLCLNSLASDRLFQDSNSIERLSLDLRTPIVGSGQPRMLPMEVDALPEDPSSEPRAILRMDVLQKVSESVPWKATRSRILAALIDRRKQLMAQDILRLALEEQLDPATVLSELLTMFCCEGLQPADPEYVSESACQALLQESIEVRSLLEETIHRQNCQSLWEYFVRSFAKDSFQPQKPRSASDQAIDDRIRDFERTYGQVVANYARGEGDPYPAWEPPDGPFETPRAYVDFVNALGLPCPSGNTPNLLLHELGNSSRAESQSARLDSIYRPGHHTVFVNTPGTGKTRLLLEGLCRSWGLYITCSVRAPGLGACDMTGELKTTDFWNLPPGTTSQLLRTDIAASNADIARELADRILLARLTIFRVYLENLTSSSDVGLQRKRWLALQLSSFAVLGHDVFPTLAKQLRIRGTTPGFIQHRITDTLLKIRTIVGRDAPIFCVLDDATLLLGFRAAAFGESTALQAILNSWEKYDDLTLLVCGVPFDIHSAATEGGKSYRVCTNTGMFDQAGEQAAYAERYIPPELLSTRAGKKLVTRICLWCRGRYRTTAMIINCLLLSRFVNPHTVLTACVASFAMIEPSDSPVEMDDAVRARCHRLPHLSPRGFAVLGGATGHEAVINEPFYIFPTVDLLFCKFPLVEGFLPATIATSMTSRPVHQGIHLAIVPLLLLACKEARKVCDLFELAYPRPPWANQTCRLVRVTRPRGDGGDLRTMPFETSWPEDGFDERWATESAAWLQLRIDMPEPFCVAAEFSHADLMFNLQLEDGAVLLVVLKFIIKNEHIAVTTQDFEHCVAQLAPDRLFHGVAGSSADQQHQLSGLATSLDGVGTPFVLRVVATFPDRTDIGTIPQDGQPYPVGMLNLKLLQDVSERVTYRSVLRRLHHPLITRRRVKMVGYEVPRVWTDDTLLSE
ncbi:hypothetical protein GGG16DRAFT_104586 [Schizophyllum commune]